MKKKKNNKKKREKSRQERESLIKIISSEPRTTPSANIITGAGGWGGRDAASRKL